MIASFRLCLCDCSAARVFERQPASAAMEQCKKGRQLLAGVVDHRHELAAAALSVSCFARAPQYEAPDGERLWCDDLCRCQRGLGAVARGGGGARAATVRAKGRLGFSTRG